MKRKLLLFAICIFTFSFANAQLNSVAVVGGGTLQNWPNPGDIDENVMTKTGADTWVINNLMLLDGAVKFRGNNSYDVYNWGATDFPSGIAESGSGAGITVGRGLYNVTFNSSTSAYTFVKTADLMSIISIIGGAIPADSNHEIDMTSSDGNIYKLNNVLLSAANLKFRLDHRWTQNWGGTDLPSGTGVQDAADLAIPTEGRYDITFNKSTKAYNIVASTLSVNDFNAISFKAYPNPTQNNWSFSSSTENIESIAIVDITGKTVKTSTPKSNQVTIDASDLTAGLYVAKVTTATAAQTLKLIKR